MLRTVFPTVTPIVTLIVTLIVTPILTLAWASAWLSSPLLPAVFAASPIVATQQAATSKAATSKIAAPQAASAIVVAPEIMDLGAIEPGSTHPAKFTLINTGAREVTVLGAVPNCKCTAISDIKGKRIPPGGTLELSASLAAPRAPGVKEAVVFLTFEGAAPTKATIKGDVRLKVVAEPPYVDALKDVTSGSVKLRAADGKPFSVLRSGGRDPVFVGFDPKTDAPRAEYVIAWDLSGRACEAMPIWWFVFTDRPDCPAIPLRVRDECTGSKADMGRFGRFWIAKEGLIDAGLGLIGTASEVEIDLDHYNPAKKGAIERVDWSAVKAVRSLSPIADAAFISKRDVGADVVVVKLAITPKQPGPIEGELEIETATGTGRVPFTIFARAR